ncbi:hypothetical protein Trydic_g8894 [Trypoxylus dichotomus]
MLCYSNKDHLWRTTRISACSEYTLIDQLARTANFVIVQMNDWCMRNGLSANGKKLVCSILKCQHNHSMLAFQSDILVKQFRNDSLKFLGLITDHGLTSTAHCA